LGAIDSYKLRLRRKRYKLRAFRKRRELTVVVNRSRSIGAKDILSFSTIRNERVRLPYFLKYYRNMGIGHFFFVDNGSDDGSAEFLAEQSDVTLFSTTESYKESRFGVDWLNWLQRKFAHGHWSLVVDVDEFFVYPFCDMRPIQALTDWLDASSIRSFGAFLLDMYPKGPINEAVYKEGQDPFEIAAWFDSGNYTIIKNAWHENLWIQGGPRARVFFSDRPHKSPALNKIPLVKWDSSYAYISSTHSLLPRGLNRVYEEGGGEKTSGCLLHAKFLDVLSSKASEETKRGEHFGNSQEYIAYHEGLKRHPELWVEWSERYINWRQLEILGLISKGNWA